MNLSRYSIKVKNKTLLKSLLMFHKDTWGMSLEIVIDEYFGTMSLVFIFLIVTIS